MRVWRADDYRVFLSPARKYQGITARSISEVSRKRAILMAEITTTQANTVATSNACCLLCMKIPNPYCAPTYSPQTAPITQYVTAILTPENKDGSAPGNRTCLKIDHVPAPNVRNKRIRSGSVARKPS